MLNLTIPPQANTASNDKTLSSHADASTKSSPDNEQFNKILAKETDKSANTTTNTDNIANNKTAPAEKSLAEQSNVKMLPQTPENASKLAQHHAPKKLISFELELGSDTPALTIEDQPINETTSPFAPILTMSTTHPMNESIGHVAGTPRQIASTTLSATFNPTSGSTLPASVQSTQQGPSRHTPYLNNYLNNSGQQLYSPANSATFDQILPPRTNAASTLLTRSEDAIKFASSEFTQPSGMNNLSPTTPFASSTISTPLSLGIDTQVGQPKWGGELAQKVVWLSSQQQQVAEIRLNPAHLGPVDIMLNVNNDQATAQFVSAHLAVREAIEASLPRLREMMAENGITLGDVSVGAESFQQQADTRQNNKESTGHGYDSHLSGMNGESMDNIESSIPLNRHNGIVNTFA
ncbi:MAG: flagellar hook-length control protein FliK [Nitrosomonas sp.]|nr:flagellar hook-length control protein FliK [Nitrosomonas sp.]